MSDPISFDPFLGWVDTTDPDNLPEDVRIIGASDLLRYENFAVAATAKLNALAAVTSAGANAPVLNNVGGDWSQLRALTSALSNYNPGDPTPIKVLGLGSDVAAGSGLLDPATSAPVQLFAQAIRDVFNVEVDVYNHTVSGHVLVDGAYANGDYVDGKAAAGWTPDVVFAVYGMDDGKSDKYHSGWGGPGGVNTLWRRIEADYADLIITTTPHPHTARASWALTGSGHDFPRDDADVFVQIPGPTVAASIATGDPIAAGIDVPYSRRHRHVNQAYAREASTNGVPVLDVERFWFLAVEEFGEDLLFQTDEAYKPNITGIQASYGLAIRSYVHGLANAIGRAGQYMPRATHTQKPSDTARTNTDTLADDPSLKFSLRTYEAVEVTAVLFVTTTSDADLKVAFGANNTITGRWGIASQPGGGGTAVGWQNIGNVSQVFGGTGTQQMVVIHGIIAAGSAGADVVLRWAQGTAHASNTTIHNYSYLKTRTNPGPVF